MSHPTRFVLDGPKLTPADSELPADLRLMEGIIRDIKSGRHTLWRKLGDNRWEQIAGRFGVSVIEHPDGIRHLSADEDAYLQPPRRWGGLLGPAAIPEYEKKTVPLPDGFVDVRRDTASSSTSKESHKLIWHPHQALTREQIAATLAGELRDAEQLDQDGRLWIAHGTTPTMSREQVSSLKFRYTIHEESARKNMDPVRGAAAVDEVLQKLDVQRLWKELSLVTNTFSLNPSALEIYCDHKDTLKASVGYRTDKPLSDRLPDGRHILRSHVASEAFGMRMAFGNHESPRDLEDLRSLFIHECGHVQQSYRPQNWLIGEAMTEMSCAMVKETFDKEWADVVGGHPCTVLHGPSIEETGYNLGDGLPDIGLGAMKMVMAEIGAYRLRHHWLKNDPILIKRFFQACHKDKFNGKMPTTDEWLATMDKVVPGFSERYHADPITKIAQERTQVLSFPHFLRGKQRGLYLAAYSYTPNPSAGLTRGPIKEHYSPTWEDFDLTPGTATQLKLEARVIFDNDKEFSIKITGGAAIDFDMLRARLIAAGKGKEIPDTCNVKTIVQLPEGEKEFDLGVFEF